MNSPRVARGFMILACAALAVWSASFAEGEDARNSASAVIGAADIDSAALDSILTGFKDIDYPTEFDFTYDTLFVDSSAVRMFALHPQLDQVTKYSPRIVLNDDETLYPVMPHAFAFDGEDNNGDGLFDLEDPLELGAGLLNLEAISRFHIAKRPMLVIIDNKALLDEIRWPYRNQSQRWLVGAATREALRSAGIELSPKAFFSVERSQGELVDPLSWAKLDDELSRSIWELRGDSSSLDDKALSRLRHFGIPLDQARVTPFISPEDQEEGRILAGRSTWGPSIQFTAFREDSVLSLYQGIGRGGDVSAARNDGDQPSRRGATIYGVYGLDAPPDFPLSYRDRIILTRSSAPPEPRVGFRMAPEARTGGHRIDYWLYFLYDAGVGPHVHDAEHAIVYTDHLGGVAAFAASAHSNATASNVLLRDRHPHLGVQRPQNLHDHMSLLVELGKHALAPDRNSDGRFDLGMDANYGYNAAWGQRDLNNAFASNQIGEFHSEYSFPRTGHLSLFDAFRPDLSSVMDTAYSHLSEAFPGETYPWGYRGFGIYRLYSVDDFEELYRLLRDRFVSRQQVREFLWQHRSCFWGGMNYSLPPEIPADSWTVMKAWASKTEKDPRRDFWEHDDYKESDRIFRPWLFSRLAFVVGVANQAPRWRFPVGLQLAGMKGHLRHQTVRLMADCDPHVGGLRDVRIALSDARGAMASLTGGVGRAGALRDPPRFLAFLEYSPAQAWAPHFIFNFLRVTPVAGLRTTVGAHTTDWRLHAGLHVEIPVVGPKDPFSEDDY